MYKYSFNIVWKLVNAIRASCGGVKPSTLLNSSYSPNFGSDTSQVHLLTKFLHFINLTKNSLNLVKDLLGLYSLGLN